MRIISDAPFLYKRKKNDPPIDFKNNGVVGTRNITPYGKEVTERLVRGLVSHGFTIVSGLAYGVDAIAHQTAIDAGGKTIAVLGCGIDIIAPASNARLYSDIANGAGALVSEMPIGLRPDKGLFIARNRIISGLSLGVVVTENCEYLCTHYRQKRGEQGRRCLQFPGRLPVNIAAAPQNF